MTHSPGIMPSLRLSLLTLCVCGAALGAEPAASTAKVQPMSLQEAIQHALQNNLSVQIERLNPQIARYSLSGAYEAYDPTMSVSADQSYSRDEGQLNQVLGIQEQAGERWNENFQTGIQGKTPIGTTYSLNADIVRNSGAFSRIVQPDPNLPPFSSVFNRPFQYGTFAGISLSQPLLRNFWIDGTRANISIAKTQIKISEAAFRAQVHNVINNVEQAYYNLIFARENVKVQEKALELAERLALENRKKVEVGALAPLDEKQAESQVAANRADLLSAKTSLAQQENVLKNLITADFAAWTQTTLVPAEALIAVPMSFDLQESWQKGFTQRPDLQQLKLDLEQRDIRIRYARNQMFPELDLRGSYGLNGVDSTLDPALGDIRNLDNPAYSVGAIVSIPLGNVGPRNRHRTSKAEKQQALLRLKQYEQTIMVQIDDAVKNAQTTLQRVDATHQARLFAESALDAEQKKLENGKSTSFQVLQFQRDLTSARFQEIRALAEYNNALSDLAFREGSTLERHKINLTVK